MTLQFSIFVSAPNTKCYASRMEGRIHIEADRYLVNCRSREKKVMTGVTEEPNSSDKLR